MQVRKERIINEFDVLKENQDLLKRVMAGMRRRMQVPLHEMEDISKETEISRFN